MKFRHVSIRLATSPEPALSGRGLQGEETKGISTPAIQHVIRFRTGREGP